MPLPHLVSPPPGAQNPRSFEDQEARARLKLHILMARLRTGLRSVLDKNRPLTIPDWEVNLQDETGQVLSHIGVCTVNGFRIQIPYLVKELADMMYESDGETLFDSDALLASIDVDFNKEEDNKILGSTEDFFYWWKNTGESEGSTEESKGSTAEAEGSTAEAKGSTAEAEGSTQEADGSTQEADGSTGEAEGSTGESEGSTGESEGSTGESKGNTGPTKAEFTRVTHLVTASHFEAFWPGSTFVMRQGIENTGWRYGLNVPVAGLAPRPSPPDPPTMASAAVTQSGSQIPTCPSCTPIREALRQTHERLLSAQMRIQATIIAGKEAVRRSSVRVDAYEILDKVVRKHGIPFEGGDPLPAEFKDYIPVHKFDDYGITREVEKRELTPPPILGTTATTKSMSPTASNTIEQDTGNETASESESDESVPKNFRLSDYEVSDDGSSQNALGEESENDRNWELYAEEVIDSDVEQGDMDYDTDGTGGSGSGGDSS